MSGEEVAMDSEIKETTATSSTVPMEVLARKSCRKCYGRGYTGKFLDGRLVPCRCLRVHYMAVIEGEPDATSSKSAEPTQPNA